MTMGMTLVLRVGEVNLIGQWKRICDTTFLGTDSPLRWLIHGFFSAGCWSHRQHYGL